MISPSFSVIVPTAGRPTLQHTLDSIARQGLRDRDEVWVVLDSFEQGPRPDIRDLVESYGHRFRLLTVDGGEHWYGVAQLNHVLQSELPVGDYLLTLGDDDIYVDHAWDVLRAVAWRRPEPILFQFLSPWRTVLWDRPRLAVSHISGQCIAVPNGRGMFGLLPTDRISEADFVWINDIMRRWGGESEVCWLAEVLVIARPDIRHGQVVHLGVTHCAQCHGVRYREDVDAAGRCYFCQSLVSEMDERIALHGKARRQAESAAKSGRP